MRSMAPEAPTPDPLKPPPYGEGHVPDSPATPAQEAPMAQDAVKVDPLRERRGAGPPQSYRTASWLRIHRRQSALSQRRTPMKQGILTSILIAAAASVALLTGAQALELQAAPASEGF